MDKNRIVVLKSDFDSILRSVENEGVEYSLARELMPRLAYAKWENFLTAIQRAMAACTLVGASSEDHFRDIRKMVDLGSGSKREIQDFMLTRYACYLIAQNGDPRKEAIAFAQSYFAVQTRKQEILEEMSLPYEYIPFCHSFLKIKGGI